MEKLESYVIDNALKEKIVADFKEQVESVNDALERLKAEDIPCDLPTLKKIMSSDESFKKWLVKAEDEFIGKLQHFGKTSTMIVFSTIVENRGVVPE